MVGFDHREAGRSCRSWLTLQRIIGHRAIIYGCCIGDDSLVGMGAIILNGASISRNCLIGTRALVTEGTVIRDNSLAIGSPGRVV
ncbi:MAG: DapH/DapD/GlmU-related protein [Octadecabacter sp.]|nr:DapH/DapD/GlmU-related protein [Octadecabacter sp.]